MSETRWVEVVIVLFSAIVIVLTFTTLGEQQRISNEPFINASKELCLSKGYTYAGFMSKILNSYYMLKCENDKGEIILFNPPNMKELEGKT